MELIQIARGFVCILLGVVVAGLFIGTPATFSIRSRMFRIWCLSVIFWLQCAYLAIFVMARDR